MIAVGFAGGSDAQAAIRAAGIHAAVLQPAARIALPAMEQAHRDLSSGPAGGEAGAGARRARAVQRPRKPVPTTAETRRPFHDAEFNRSCGFACAATPTAE